jgi:integrase
MTCFYESNFAGRIQEFIAQKRAIGYSYKDCEKTMSNFDCFCLENFPTEMFLSKELCHAWALDSKYKPRVRGRLSPVREFARYLNRIGEPAYIIPGELSKKDIRHVPHIYTESEIASLWRIFDEITPRRDLPVRHLVTPAIFRLIYCCGLRPCEARRLNVADVNLCRDRIDILESKGHKSRIVVMADDVTAYMAEYDRQISERMPHRTTFFPNSRDGMYSRPWLNGEFNTARVKAGITQFGDNMPRVYDFRHSFATHKLYQWMREGRNMDAMLPYLSAYMGHVSITSTYYYIHLVPGIFETMSGTDYFRLESLIPEVEDDE